MRFMEFFKIAEITKNRQTTTYSPHLTTTYGFFIDFSSKMNNSGRGEVWYRTCFGSKGLAGSNPVAPTKNPLEINDFRRFYFCFELDMLKMNLRPLTRLSRALFDVLCSLFFICNFTVDFNYHFS